MTMPQAYRIVMSKRVATDLQRIFDYIAEDSPKLLCAWSPEFLATSTV